MRAVLLAGLAVGALGRAAGAQATERKTVPGADVAIYNLAGVLRLEQGSGAGVGGGSPRGGGDAAKLRIETGEIRGRQTLRVMYPDDDIVYDALGRWGGVAKRPSTYARMAPSTTTTATTGGGA